MCGSSTRPTAIWMTTALYRIMRTVSDACMENERVNEGVVNGVEHIVTAWSIGGEGLSLLPSQTSSFYVV